MSWQTPLTR
jgi:hypothetical protein